MGTRVIDRVTVTSLAPAAITTAAAYGATTDTIVDLRGLKDKALLVKNTHAANSLTYTVLGSLNDGVSYDLVIKADTAVAGLAQDLFRNADYVTHWKIRVRDTVAASNGIASLQLAAI